MEPSCARSSTSMLVMSLSTTMMLSTSGRLLKVSDLMVLYLMSMFVNSGQFAMMSELS